jgi:hypothetical protein
MGVQTYYETICKNQPLARRNLIVKELWLGRGQKSQKKHDFIVVEVGHLEGHNISDRLDRLIIEGSQDSPIGSLSSSTTKHIVSQCKDTCFTTNTDSNISSKRRGPGDRHDTSKLRSLNFGTDPSVRKLYLLEELFRLVTIISKDSYLYSTDIDESYWFAATVMETVPAISLAEDLNDSDEIDSGWIKHIFRKSKKKKKLYEPQSECGRRIVAAYRADKKKHPIPTAQSRQSDISNVAPASGNETEEAIHEAEPGQERREERM